MQRAILIGVCRIIPFFSRLIRSSIVCLIFMPTFGAAQNAALNDGRRISYDVAAPTGAPKLEQKFP